jgi:hypothetical protein
MSSFILKKPIISRSLLSIFPTMSLIRGTTFQVVEVFGDYEEKKKII